MGDSSSSAISIVLAVGILVLYIIVIIKFFSLCKDVRQMREILEENFTKPEPDSPLTNENLN
jgi:hypothetical protein